MKHNTAHSARPAPGTAVPAARTQDGTAFTKGRHRIAHAVLETLNTVTDLLFIAVLIILLLFAAYTRWDSDKVYGAADPKKYIMYKPTKEDKIPFSKLQKMNPDVLGWLTIYGTNIDYPLVQSEDNEYYLDHNAKKDPEASGSLFLDYRNRKDFSDFNTIIFGHHMAEHKMFGDIDEFLDEDFFDSHQYGNVYYNGKNHGLQIVAMLRVDAYDSQMYTPAVSGETGRLSYINHIYDKALFLRGVDANAQRNASVTDRQEPITPEDHLVIMSTCSEDITNGRFILVGKLLDHTVENPYQGQATENKSARLDMYKISEVLGKFPNSAWFTLLILAIVLISLYEWRRHHDTGNEEND